MQPFYKFYYLKFCVAQHVSGACMPILLNETKRQVIKFVKLLHLVG
jgi:hypothetical protein